MAYQNQSSTCQLFYLAGMRRRREFEPIRVAKIVSRHADSFTLKVFRVSPKREFALFYLALTNINTNLKRN